jgi:hypothetical protein
MPSDIHKRQPQSRAPPKGRLFNWSPPGFHPF